MRILILGADGMLGHQLVCSFKDRHDVAGTVRRIPPAADASKDWHPQRLFPGVDLRDIASVERVFEAFLPEAVVNAAGIVKQRNEAKYAIESIEVNALLPHRLADVCSRAGVRMIHLSTDCVFSGDRGNYADDALHDARDLYGRTKSLGEVSGEGVMTLRTSIIGLELGRKKSLIEWFLAQSGVIRGFTQAIYSGFTTVEMARIIERLLVSTSPISGISNVSSDPIDKFALLEGLRKRLGHPVEIVPDSSFRCDRSLDSTAFRARFRYQPPTWDAMLDELADQIKRRDHGGTMR
jgi:dTDP-4-dehydrorhamnose reductase